MTKSENLTYDDVRNASLAYFDNDQLAAEVFAGKYALKLPSGAYTELTPTAMHERLAREFYRVESKYPNPMSYEEIFDLFSSFDPVTGQRGMGDVIPQGSPMSAVGNIHQFQSLSNCFVIESPYDSYGGIMKTDQEQAQLMKRRGGVGFDISTIRPRGLLTANAASTTDGIGVFMERFSNTCREVAQGGRRGALMLSVSVHHPEIRTFINIKRDKKKVTGANISIRLTDEFMNAVKHGDTVQLRFPVEKEATHQISNDVDARELWTEIIEAAHVCAEPGLLFWDTILGRGPADVYPEFRSTSTNPCLTGDTKIAVADGRGYVPIKDLAAAEVDVPVYCMDTATGKIAVRKMRHPRLTGHNQPVYKVTLEGGHSFKATPNHKMILRDGSEKRVDELKNGDSLWIAHRVSARFHEALPYYKATQSQNYWWVKDCNSSRWRTEHRLIWEHHHNCKVPPGHVIHHADFHASNNSVENLHLMQKRDYDQLHAECIKGDLNPIFKIKADPERFAQYSKTMSLATSGSDNGNAYATVSDEDIRQHVILLTRSLGCRASIKIWYKYAKENNLPQSFSCWRSSTLGSFYDLSIWAATECGITYPSLDPRLHRTLTKALEQGYTADIIDNEVTVERCCEHCGSSFVSSYSKREGCFCSISCSNYYANSKTSANVNRTASLHTTYQAKAEKSKTAILDTFTQLRLELGRDPYQKELESRCHSLGFSYRTGTKFGFRDWADVKSTAATYNHRVVSVEYVGTEDVYNGTVDNFHNLCMALGEESLDGFSTPAALFTVSRQCGEITLNSNDSCRLMLVNLYRFVDDPFTSKARFNYSRFDCVVQKAQRLMDNMIDLELECIDRILAKVEQDPEPEDVKSLEVTLWNKIRNSAVRGRRTGLGITALGDALAALGIRYGSDESVTATHDIYRALAMGAYRSSVQMAEERGAFPAFDLKIERNHPFLRQIMAEDQALEGRYLLYGRRNIGLTTTAPAGSVSILTQSTSGCEPVFKLAYTRRKKHNPNDQDAKIDFVDELGDKWQHYTVFHHGVKTWMEVTGNVNIEESPYWKATSEDIDWVKKIDIQAAAQKWICHSISNTTNIPKETTVDTVKQIYMRGWESGCKGVTIYREGSRDGVMFSEEAAKEIIIVDTHAPKRPKVLPCDIHRANVKGESYLVVVGRLDDRPYELFCGLSLNVEIPKRVKEGRLVKNGKNADGISLYNLEIPIGDDDQLVIKDIVTVFDNPIYGAFTRTISLALRHGVPVKFLVEQLRKDKHSDMWSFSTVIARVLSKHYIPDGTKTTSEKHCKECKSTELSYQQGCVTCMTCGSSKCS